MSDESSPCLTPYLKSIVTLNLTGHSGLLSFSGISTTLIGNLLFNFCKQRINVSSQKVKRL